MEGHFKHRDERRSLAATAAAGLPGVTRCDPGFTISEIGLVTRYTPVKNLTFSAEVMFAYLKTNMAGTVIATPSSALPLSTAAYTYGSNGTTSLNLRVQRNFRSRSSNNDLIEPPAGNRWGFFVVEQCDA